MEKKTTEWKEKSGELRVQTPKTHRKRRRETPSTSHWSPIDKTNKQNEFFCLFVCFASLQIVWEVMVKQPQMATVQTRQHLASLLSWVNTEIKGLQAQAKHTQK